MTAHMEKGPAIHGNDLKDLRSGISAIRRKLDSQKIIDEVNIERLGITVGKEVRRMEWNFLSSSAAAYTALLLRILLVALRDIRTS